MRPPSLVLPLLALLALAIGAGPAAAASTAQGASAKQRDRVVLSPRANAVVRSHVVRVRVRAGDRARLRARLHGVDVSSEFGRARRGVRTLRVSASHGLRHGRNVLRVRVHRLARPAQTARVRFTVRRSDPLVGAGRHRTVVVGERSTLLGRVVSKRGKHRGSTRWRIVGGPRRGASAAKAGRRTGLASPAGRTAALRPAEHGSYTLKFTSGTGDDAISDLVTIDAVEDGPLVPIDTHAKKAGKVGVAVGGRFYEAGADGTVQLVQLDRGNLRLRQNSSLPSGSEADAANIKAEVGALANDMLVIAVMRGKPARVPDGSFYTHLGVPADAKAVYTAIGVPGVSSGGADYIGTGPNGANATDGRMSGYLTKDPHHNFGFVPDEREPFAYGRAPVKPCPASVDDDPECRGDVGFRITVLDAHTLQPASYMKDKLKEARVWRGMFFNTNGRGYNEYAKDAEAQRMIMALGFVRPNDVVVIQAASNILPGEQTYLPPVGRIFKPTMKALARAVMDVGGTRSAFNAAAKTPGSTGGIPHTGMTDSHGANYILVGWQGAAEGNGAEAAANVDNAGGAPALSGVLRPNEALFFRPAQVKSSLGETDTLGELVLRPPTHAWPLDGNPGAQAAIKYLAKAADNRLGSNPRSAYWTQGLDEAATTSIVTALNDVRRPGDATFTPEEFDTAREQLKQELRWVGKTRTYLDHLSDPFAADEQLKGWTAAQTIADKIYEDAYKPKDEAAIGWVEFTETLLKILGPLTHEASAVLAEAMDLGMWIYGATQGGEPSDGEIRRQADEVGEVLVNRADIARTTFKSMGDVIVSDYKKLQIVGKFGGCSPDPEDPESCPKQWALDTTARAVAVKDVRAGVERYAYEKLLPLGYHVFGLGQRVSANSPGTANFLCSGTFAPFEHYGHPAIMSLLQEYDPAGKDNVWETFAFSRPPGALTETGTPPSEELLNTLFDPVTQGGLGISVERLMRSSKHDRWGIDCRYWW